VVRALNVQSTGRVLDSRQAPLLGSDHGQVVHAIPVPSASEITNLRPFGAVGIRLIKLLKFYFITLHFISFYFIQFFHPVSFLILIFKSNFDML